MQYVDRGTRHHKRCLRPMADSERRGPIRKLHARCRIASPEHAKHVFDRGRDDFGKGAGPCRHLPTVADMLVEGQPAALHRFAIWPAPAYPVLCMFVPLCLDAALRPARGGERAPSSGEGGPNPCQSASLDALCGMGSEVPESSGAARRIDEHAYGWECTRLQRVGLDALVLIVPASTAATVRSLVVVAAMPSFVHGCVVTHSARATRRKVIRRDSGLLGAPPKDRLFRKRRSLLRQRQPCLSQRAVSSAQVLCER